MPRRLVWAHERVCLTLVRLRRCRWRVVIVLCPRRRLMTDCRLAAPTKVGLRGYRFGGNDRQERRDAQGYGPAAWLVFRRRVCSEPSGDRQPIGKYAPSFCRSTSKRFNRDTLLACNSMVLCCSAGPSGDPGWMRAATLSRIWYVRRTFVAC
jgi:hypothetical protein